VAELTLRTSLPLTRPAVPAEPGLPPDDTGGSDRPGRRVVFTGEWLLDGCPCHPYAAGYTGSVVSCGNGRYVFQASRTVTEAVVAEYQHALLAVVFDHIGQGAYLSDAWVAALEEHPSITWLGSMVVIDRRASTGDDAAVEIALPDTEGLYTIGWGMAWDPVDVAAVHTVHGTPNR
jgi:hypothetical protein